MSEYLLISDAAKEVRVETHVLRYWEEELHLPIKRNELGHRYYTQEDVKRFKQIKNMKERGLQLKAIKMILKNGQLDILEEDKKETQAAELPKEANVSKEANTPKESGAAKETAVAKPLQAVEDGRISKEEKARRLRWILQQMMRETLQENNRKLCEEIKESVIKEMDYQFRMQEERDEERQRETARRNEQYYQKMDELLRVKSKKKSRERKKPEGETPADKPAVKAEKTEKKKRHFIF